MHLMKSIVLVPVLALATAATLSAQQGAQGREADPDQRGYVSGYGGAIAGPAAPAFGVEYGDNISPNVQAFITLSYFENLMKQPLRDDLATLGTSLSTLTGKPWDLHGRDRGVSLVSGAKYLLGSGTIRPYVGGGAGIISLRRTVIEARIGDVRDAIFNDFAVGEVDLLRLLEALALRRRHDRGAHRDDLVVIEPLAEPTHLRAVRGPA